MMMINLLKKMVTMMLVTIELVHMMAFQSNARNLILIQNSTGMVKAMVPQSQDGRILSALFVECHLVAAEIQLDLVGAILIQLRIFGYRIMKIN